MDTAEDIEFVKDLLTKHLEYTQSKLAQKILTHWAEYQTQFVKVIPQQYQRVLEAIHRGKQQGLSEEQAIMEAANG